MYYRHCIAVQNKFFGNRKLIYYSILAYFFLQAKPSESEDEAFAWIRRASMEEGRLGARSLRFRV